MLLLVSFLVLVSKFIFMRIVYLILTSLIVILVELSSYNFWYADCAGADASNDERSAVEFLQDCSGDMNNAISNQRVGIGWMQELIISISEKVIIFGALFAIGAIVFSGIQYTTSYGDDEKVKKAKTTGIYALIGLLLLLVSFPLVNTIVSFIYWFAG